MKRGRKRARNDVTVSRDEDSESGREYAVRVEDLSITIGARGRVRKNRTTNYSKEPADQVGDTHLTDSAQNDSGVGNANLGAESDEDVVIDRHSAQTDIGMPDTDESDVDEVDDRERERRYDSVSEVSDNDGGSQHGDIDNQSKDEAMLPNNLNGAKKRGSFRQRKAKLAAEWNDLRNEYLSELSMHEAPNVANNQCIGCHTTFEFEGPRRMDGDQMEQVASEKRLRWMVKCSECIGAEPLCASCVLETHSCHPLHKIKRYNGYFWEKLTLRDLGLQIHLGHSGEQCRYATERRTLTVLHTGGYQKMDVTFCKCQDEDGEILKDRVQLMRIRLYPATIEQPKTVATFDVLDVFLELSYQSKVSRYDFYQTLLRLTDVTEVIGVKKRYEEFTRMCRQYEHLKMLLYGGRGVATTRVEDTADGELAVKCPACPHPNINLPDDWKSRENGLFVMLDANFRLKLKARGIIDPDLSRGWAYFVTAEVYKEHLRNHVEAKEMRYCGSGLRAVDHANIKGGKGYDASGVVAIQCRHMFILPNGVGDLQRGEKFGNIDFILLSALFGFALQELVISYDIACQYSKKFAKRMEQYPPELWLCLGAIAILFVIPKFHLLGHGDSCQTLYSFNFRQHVGRTDGENIERGWAHLNAMSPATKEMGSGSRQDTLNAHLGAWNFIRLVLLGATLLRKLTDAEKAVEVHGENHREFCKGFEQDEIDSVYDKMEAYEKDPTKALNPFVEHERSRTFNEVKKFLAESRLKDARKGQMSDGDISVEQWLAVGIELQEQQETLKTDIGLLGRAEATEDIETITETKANLWTKLCRWKDRQPEFMHGIREEQSIDDEQRSSENAHKATIILPSSLPVVDRERQCVEGLSRKEGLLRQAQALDALKELRQLLLNQYVLVNKKILHVAGQKNLTKSNYAINEAQRRITLAAERYRKARNALVALDPQGLWSKELLVLKAQHVRGPRDAKSTKLLVSDPKDVDDPKDMDEPDEPDEPEAAKRKTGEGARTQTWIWGMRDIAWDWESKKVPEQTSTETVVDNIGKDGKDKACEVLLVELAKSKARSDRWEEEVILVKEEMRRVLMFLRWKANDWITKADEHKLLTITRCNDGAVCYANRQAWMLRCIAEKFKWMWSKWEIEDDARVDREFLSVGVYEPFDIGIRS